MDPDG